MRGRFSALVVAAPALAALLGAAAADAHRGNHGLCPQGYKQRSAAEVLADHRAWLAVGDVERVVQCNYAPDAVVVSDMSIDEGRDAIRLGLQAMVGFFGGAVPTLHSEVIVQALNHNTEMARVLFSVTTPCIDVPDGADTYIIKRGQIHAQTAHGFPVFKCGPPPF